MQALRTPDDRFEGLAGYPFAPHYAEVTDGLRIHYLDEGPESGGIIVLMHGEPSWSYLYRTMIPVLVDAGYRCIAPDLIGFGRSDKPTQVEDYTYARHVEWIRSLLIDTVKIQDATFFGQDWGGLAGLRVVAENPEHFSRIVVGNTGLADRRRPDLRGVPQLAEVLAGDAELRRRCDRQHGRRDPDGAGDAGGVRRTVPG